MTSGRSRKRAEFEDEALVHVDALYGLALRLTGGDEARSEDLVRETMLEAYRAWDSFEVGTGCRAWLLTILRDTFLAGVGREPGRRVTGEPGDAAGREPDEGRPVFAEVGERDPEGRFFRRISDEEVARAVESLPEEIRVPLVLCDLEGFSYRGVADALGVRAGTVKSRLFRARGRLQEEMYAHAVEMGYLS